MEPLGATAVSILTKLSRPSRTQLNMWKKKKYKKKKFKKKKKMKKKKKEKKKKKKKIIYDMQQKNISLNHPTRYRLCPFHNATQQEEVLKWRAYGGVIG